MYDGALPLCGANQSDHSFLSEMFANRAVFDYFFPDVLPPLDKVPADYRATRAAGEAAAKLAETPAMKALAQKAHQVFTGSGAPRGPRCTSA